MADQNAQQEPSMEEILASIRKIISEDDEAEKDAATDVTDAPSPAPRTDDDVLELTEVVESAAPPGIEQPDDVEEDEAPEEDPAAAIDSVMAAVRRAEAEPDSDDIAPETEIDLTGGAESRTDESPAPFASEPARSTSDEGGLISGQAASAASQALAELAGSLDEGRPRADTAAAFPLGGSNRTVEDLVREMLRPMLRDWLDANLPDLVQRLVRKEIKEMVRRAEDR